MLDLSYFQNSGNVNTQTFTNAGSWVTWVKPRGAKFVNIFCMGAGSGGGGGFQTGSATRFAGAGGSSGGVVSAQFQASILPDILYVYTGVGGVGGTGGAAGIVTAGGNGERSFVCLIPSTSSIQNIVVTSGAVAAIGGQSGSAVSPAGRSGETQATTANAIFLNLGTFIAAAGTAGSAPQSSTTSTINFINFPGAGGGSTGNGANVTVAGPFPITTPVAIAGSGATNGQNGRNGYTLTKPILGFMGGNGGGGIASGGTGNAGNGGNASYGSGGGGGGSAQTGIAGNGGRGGDGLIIITTSF